ncbi:redoxin domain-containing protein [Mucilaginibacter sp. X5P1]|uniref:TlpA disulfide reductase family protein n=1 Tax=Mucilaginibacter sp. X5P1 TaxID=2723088 RepID=UPI0016070D9E|nr:TlpA disulfide reductase family protein [Mucilaginibacter sp. X5P1]MBB6137558.1 peroxiredoxin [Mucilaginibacter sp. X5P1]
MKRMILLALAIAPATVWAQSNNYVLKAKIGNYKAPAKAYLLQMVNGKQVVDSALIDNGAFQFTGTVAEPARAQLVLDHYGEGLARLAGDADVTMLYLEKGNINITAKDSVKYAIITGSKVNDDNAKYEAVLAGPEKTLKAINAEYAAAPADKKKDQKFVNGLQSKFDTAMEQRKELQRRYIKENPDSYVSLMALTEVAGQDIEVTSIEPLYKGLSAGVRNTTAGLAFAKSIDAARATSIGAIAPVFTQNDVNDKPVSLASFRGKYVLVDFWASWCGPCRGENPNVVKAYGKYKTKNFTVLGVSLDRPGKKDAWLAAIKADGLEWTQVSDLKFWDNEAAKAYGIRAIPQNYLIDPSGKIIAKNLRGDELNKKLATLFN